MYYRFIFYLLLLFTRYFIITIVIFNIIIHFMCILSFMNKNKITFYTCITIVNDQFVYLMYGIFNTENRNNPTILPGTNRHIPFTVFFFFYFVLFFYYPMVLFSFRRRPQWSTRCFIFRYQYRALHVMILPCTRLSYVLAHTRVIVNMICFHFLSSPCTRFAPL